MWIEFFFVLWFLLEERGRWDDDDDGVGVAIDADDL